MLETNLDHLSAEELAFACEELLAEGALDVWQTPIVMKKGRSAVMLSVLVAEADAPRFAARVIELTGSLGVRVRTAERFVAPREVVEVADRVGIRAGEGRARAGCGPSTTTWRASPARPDARTPTSRAVQRKPRETVWAADR